VGVEGVEVGVKVEGSEGEGGREGEGERERGLGGGDSPAAMLEEDGYSWRKYGQRVVCPLFARLVLSLQAPVKCALCILACPLLPTACYLLRTVQHTCILKKRA